LFTGEQQNNFEPFGPAWNITHIQLDTASTILFCRVPLHAKNALQPTGDVPGTTCPGKGKKALFTLA